MSDETVRLKAFHPWVGFWGRDIVVHANLSDRIYRIDRGATPSYDPSGLYAKYPEGVFVAFRTANDRTMIGWRKVLIDVEDIERIDWEAKMFHRRFVCHMKDGSSRSFIYVSMFLQPWRFVTDVITPDDWWGLTCDLPSWIHSSFDDNRLDDTIRDLVSSDDALDI